MAKWRPAAIVGGLLASLGACRATAPAAVDTPVDPTVELYAVRALMARVVDWQLAQRPPQPSTTDDELVTWHAGLLALSDLSDDAKYITAVRAAGERSRRRSGAACASTAGAAASEPGEPAAAQSLLGLYLRDRDRRMIRASISALEVLADESDDLSSGQPWPSSEALFSIAPTLALATAATGDGRYLAVMNRLWWKTVAELYDRPEGLLHRDLSSAATRAPNIHKSFASQANGRVLAGLVRVLEVLPDDHPDRGRYAALLRSMADKLASVQRPDGGWSPQLLGGGGQPAALGGTALIAYGLAWGQNHDILDRAVFEPVVRRAWRAIAHSVSSDGHLGAGAGPTEAGAVLLAGAELFRLTLADGARSETFIAGNALAEPRFGETIELPWAPIASALGVVPGDPVIVVDQRSGAFLPSQLYDGNADGMAETLLVSAWFLGTDTRRIVVRRLAKPFRPPAPRARAYGRFIPEGQADFLWENDRIVFRLWGQRIAAEPVSSGIDIWAKRVRVPVVEGWNAPGIPDLIDVYRVGPSRGCGGLGLWEKDKLHVSGNFRGWKMLSSGPVRVAFEVTYPPWGPENLRVGETKRISLDLGHSLSRIESRFSVKEGKRRLPVAVGIVRRENDGHVARDLPATWLSYWEPPHGQDGEIGCGVALGHEGRYVEAAGHFLLVTEQASEDPFVYYAGGCWSRGLDFHSPEEWALHLASVSRRLSAPIRITM